jgi:peptide/nickel transport system substrate-binding protein
MIKSISRGAGVMIAALTASTVLGEVASAQSAPKGTLRFVVESLGNEVLDPILGSPSATKLYLPLMYDSLIGADETNSDISKETGVAKDWKISDDGKAYTFYLRQGIKFHNGEDLTAEDVKFTFERATGSRSTSALSGVLRKVIERITVDDPYTITIQLREPKFSFLFDISALVSSDSMIVPKNYIRQVGDEKFAVAPIGSGPYRLKRHVAGSAVEFEAMPKHWSIGVPKFAEFHMIGIPEQGARLTMLNGEEADVISVGRRYVEGLQKNGFLINTKLAGNQSMLLINNQWDKNSPLNDRRVRNAIALAIDSKVILAKLMLGSGVLTRCWVTDVAYSARPAGLCDPLPYDPKAARQLLTEAGYPNGIDITFRSYAFPGIPEKLEVDQAIAGYLHAVGIRAKVEVGEFGAYRAQWPQPESLPNTIANNPTLSQIVIGSLVHTFFSAEGLLSVTRGVNPRADAAIGRMLQAATLDEYKQRLMEAWAALLEEHNVVMLFSIDAKFAANPKKVDKLWPMGTSTADLGLRFLVRQ